MTPPAWSLAPALVTLRNQLDRDHPARSKASDGTIGDERHKAEKSDHNPNDRGIVCAIDVTNDPVHEVHCALIAEEIRNSKDARLKYLIFNGFILRSYDKPGIPAWTWAPYVGANTHSHHLHVSVIASKAHIVTPWQI